MEERQIQVLLEQAGRQTALGNHRGAIDLVMRALSIDPDHPRAHAALANALLAARRLPGAGIEIRTALALDGNDPWIHTIAAHVMKAERKLDDAWAHALIALDEDHGDAAVHVVAAEIQILKGDAARARELLLEALQLEANHCEALTELARLELASGQRRQAAEHITLALQADPQDREAHVVAGHIALADGDAAAAEQHARAVLTQDASHEGGIGLFTAVKAHRSWTLGVWWRFHAFMAQRNEYRRIGILVVSFVLVRIATIFADELGYETLTLLLRYGWLGLCLYSWFAPEVFRAWMQRELGQVSLDPDY